MEQRELQDMPVVELEGVTVRLGGETILDRITLAVNAGEFLAILGPNGSGKSTLLRTILGLVQPDAGTVRLLGRPGPALREARQQIGYVPQMGKVQTRFPVTAFQVVM